MSKLLRLSFAGKATFLSRLLLATVLLGSPALHADDAPEATPPADFIIYEVQQGDTLRSIAEKHLGGAEYILELMEYNEIANPGSIGPQSIISIPTRIRDTALAEISKAEDALEKSLEVMADKFAKDDYLEAVSTMENARSSRAQARYDQAIAFARLTAVNARLAKEAALRNAVVQQKVILKEVSGTVDLSTDAGVTWLPGTAGQQIASPATIRTAANAVAIVLLEDGSTIRVNPESTFSVARLALDRRTKKRETKLRVLLGEIIGTITPQDKTENPESSFELETDGASIAIRGTKLKVGADDDSVTRVAVYEGATEVSSGNKMRGLDEGYGMVAEKGKAPSKAIALPPSPAFNLPEASPFTTFDPRVTFAWKRVKNRWAVPAYRLELATDASFFQVQIDETIAGTEFTTPPLQPGSYHVRLSALDKHGLSSAASTTFMVEVKRDVAVKMNAGAKPLMVEGKPYVMANHYFAIEPVNQPNSIDRVVYTINGGAEREYSAPLVFTTEGEYHIVAWAVGIDGTRSKEVSAHTLVDLSPPAVKAGYQFFRKRSLHEPMALVQLSAADQAGVQSVEYSLNGGPFTNYVTPFEVSMFDNTRMKYRATDKLGQVSYTFETIIPGQKVKN